MQIYDFLLFILELRDFRRLSKVLDLAVTEKEIHSMEKAVLCYLIAKVMEEEYFLRPLSMRMAFGKLQLILAQVATYKQHNSDDMETVNTIRH